MKKLTLIIVYLLLTNLLLAQIVTDRPDVTESAQTVGKSHFQFESGFKLINNDYGIFNYNTLNIPEVLIRYGISNSLELRFSSEYNRVYETINKTSINGFGGFELGAKYSFFNEEDSKYRLALIGHFIVPGEKFDASLYNYAYTFTAAASYQLFSNMGLGVNLGYNENHDFQNYLLYSISLAYDINDKIGLYVEPYGYKIVSGLSSFSYNSYNFGFTYKLKDNIQLDAAYGAGFKNSILANNEKFVSLGFSFKI